MRNTVLAGSVAVALGFLLVTNPVVVEAAGQLTGGDIKNNSLTGKDVKNGSLKSADFGTGQIPAGPPGPAGATGATGATGPAGPTGPIKVQSSPATAIPADAVGVFTFVGTPVTLTLTSPSKLISSAVATLHTSAGAATVLLDVCTKLGAAAVVSGSGNAGQFVTANTDRIAFAMSGVSPTLAAGTYSVGYCAALSSVAIPADGDLNWVSGWFQAVPAASVSKPSQGRQLG